MLFEGNGYSSKIFLLKEADLTENREYGYKKDNKDWWLSSTDNETYPYVTSAGAVQTESDSTKQHGVSPAFLLDTSKILFSMNVETISDSHNAYKLTLLDSSIKTSVLTPGEGFLRIDTDHKVTVPYEVTGAASGNMTMSVLVTNGAYTDAGSSIVYYQEAESNEDGTVSFPWNDKWDGNYSADKYHIYLIAEQRQDGYATDRASKPVQQYSRDWNLLREKQK